MCLARIALCGCVCPILFKQWGNTKPSYVGLLPVYGSGLMGRAFAVPNADLVPVPIRQSNMAATTPCGSLSSLRSTSTGGARTVPTACEPEGGSCAHFATHGRQSPWVSLRASWVRVPVGGWPRAGWKCRPPPEGWPLRIRKEEATGGGL